MIGGRDRTIGRKCLSGWHRLNRLDIGHRVVNTKWILWPLNLMSQRSKAARAAAWSFNRMADMRLRQYGQVVKSWWCLPLSGSVGVSRHLEVAVCWKGCHIRSVVGQLYT